jgi:NAD(P)H-flavin reductase
MSIQLQDSSDVVNMPSNVQTVQYAHGIMMFIVFGVLLDVAIFIVKNLRTTYKHYATAHAVLGSLILAIGLAAAIEMMVFAAGGCCGGPNDVYPTHQILGFLTVILIIIQGTLGFLYKRNLESTKPFFKFKVFKLAHLLVGNFLWVITKVNVILGVYIRAPYLLIPVGVYFTLIVVVRIGFDITRGKRRKRRLMFKPIVDAIKKKLTFDQERLIELINRKATSIEIQNVLPNFKWCILDDSLCDLTGYFHPVGEYLITPVIGREIGRFMYGSDGIESLYKIKKTVHIHSSFSITQIEGMVFGKLRLEQPVFIMSSPTPNVNLAANEVSLNDTLIKPKRKSKKSFNRDETFIWSLISKHTYAEDSAFYNFQCSNVIVNTKNNLIENIGKHFKLAHGDHRKVRLYTIVMSQTEQNIKLRNELVQFFDNTTTKRQKETFKYRQSNMETILPLIIKKYKNRKDNTFTEYLHNLPLNTPNFHLSRPYGRGLELSEHSKGTHVIFAAGTGILTFLDLFDYLLRKVIYQVLLEKHGKEIADSTNLWQNQHDKELDKSFNVTLFAAFATIQDFVGLEMVRKLCEICNIHNKPLFKAYVKLADGTTYNEFTPVNTHFTASFVRQHVKDECTERVYLCGPPKMLFDLPISLNEIGIKGERVLIA